MPLSDQADRNWSTPGSCYNSREALLNRGGKKTTSENTDTLNNVFSFRILIY